jgi:hypothetical protein
VVAIVNDVSAVTVPEARVNVIEPPTLFPCCANVAVAVPAPLCESCIVPPKSPDMLATGGGGAIVPEEQLESMMLAATSATPAHR